MSYYNQEEQGDNTDQIYQNQNEGHGQDIDVNQHQFNESLKIGQFKQPEYLAKRFDNVTI